MSSNSLPVVAGEWWTDSTLWTIVGVAVAVVFGAITIWAQFASARIVSRATAPSVGALATDHSADLGDLSRPRALDLSGQWVAGWQSFKDGQEVHRFQVVEIVHLDADRMLRQFNASLAVPFLGTEKIEFVPQGTGHGFPDITTQESATGLWHVWEVKYDSDFGCAEGPRKLKKYLGGLSARPQANVGGPGWPFSQTGTDPFLGLQVTVSSYDKVPGVELYSISGGKAALLAKITGLLATSLGVAQNDALAGRVTEVPVDANHYEIRLNNVRVLSLVRVLVPGPVVYAPTLV